MGTPHHSPVPSDRCLGILSSEGTMKTAHPVIIGIDTHKASHVAVAIDTQGTRLAALSIPTNPKGYLELERWARYEEIIAHDKELERLVTERASDLMASLGIATLTVAEMLILVGDGPTRIR